MAANIYLGQYIPGNSVLHRLDPRIKLLSSIFFMIISFMSENLPSLAILALNAVVIVLFSGVSVKVYFKSTKYILFFMLLSCFINAFYGGTDAVFEFWFFSVTESGIKSSALAVLRVISLLISSSCIMFTTSPNDMSFAISSLLKPLRFFKVNVQDIAIMITVSLKFIPIIFEEANKIIDAQKSRGANFDDKNIVKRAKAYIPIIFPLFFLSFKRASDLAVAMESRCYNDTIKRTSIHELRMKNLDILCLIYIIVILIGVMCCNYLM